jgi:hypothetical protein
MPGWAWHTPVIVAAWEAKAGRWLSKADLGVKNARPYLQTKAKVQGPEFNPQYCQAEKTLM